MRGSWRALGILLVCAVAWVPGRPALAASAPGIVWTQYTCVSLWSAPSRASVFVADVIGGTGLHVTGQSADGLWDHVLFLSEIPSWVAASSVAATPPAQKDYAGDCPFPNVPNTQSNPITVNPLAGALSAAGTITMPTLLRAAPDPAARAVAPLAAGQRAAVSEWLGDAKGDIWYLAHAGGTLGWLWAYAAQLDAPDPATFAVNGAPVWRAAAGKGMWFVNYFTRHTDVTAIVQAAKAAGVTHLYPEVAVSTDGFFGQNSLDRLIPAAHAAGLKVFAWVYPYLNNVARDLEMTRQVWQYRTPTGDHADGIAADIEERLDAPAVYSYGQVLRQMVGNAVPLVATTYNPRALPSYPFPEIAANFNVIAPQDYWHNNQTDVFTAASPLTQLTLTVTTIRAELGGRNFPIEELGQMYDMFTADGAPGGNEPTGVEITADMRAAKDLGCIGVSYFEWHTASPDELDAFDAFVWG